MSDRLHHITTTSKVKRWDGNYGELTVGLGSILEEFKETEEISGIIRSLVDIYRDQIAVELAVERFLFVFDQYQEQPHLLDPHLESLLTQLLNVVRKSDSPDEVYHLAFKLLYIITKTRGFKVVVRLMPHEVADVEPVLALLTNQHPNDYQNWETRYMLLLWLSMVCMIPFDMCRLDSNLKQQGGELRKPVMERIIDVCILYLKSSDKTRDAAAYTLSRFMTRPDVKKQKLPEFIDWCLVTLTQADKSHMTGVSIASGVLSTLALLFKHGKRDDLLTFAPVILKQLLALQLDTYNSPLLKKLSTKLVQRLGLTFLKARLATWRYQRGSRSLADNLSSGPAVKVMKTDVTDDDDEEEYEIPDEVEEVVEYLLTRLKDKDTIVRWSGAKGIGRVTGRLPRELADEVVGSVMELFTITETDAAWHGGCLALAELGRRGFLLPERLPDVVPIIVKALSYDEKKGSISVGSHVRDAACYVCWAFARAYDPEKVKPYVNDIANALVITFIFDRESNVRRAAAAAFQENVGRQGQFPHGIDILTTCDYFAVALRMNCYFTLSLYVAQFEEYTKSMIDHLVNVKSNHWDLNIRDLAAESLQRLTPKAIDYCINSVLPRLLEKSLSKELNQRHGAISAAASITLALSKHGQEINKPIEDIIGEESVRRLCDITVKLHDAQLFRGMGGELMRRAVCCLIRKLSEAHLHVTDTSVTELWQNLLDDCLQHKEPIIQEAAVSALPAFVTEYYRDGDGRVNRKAQDLLIRQCIKELNNSLENIRIGNSLALGSLPKFFLEEQFDVVLKGLIEASWIKNKDCKMADARKEAVKAIACLCKTVGVSRGGNMDNELCEDNVPRVYDAFFAALSDYTLDSRGDVGSWVREAAMTGLSELTTMLLTADMKDLVTPQISQKLFGSILQQACEKIDRTRGLAGELFYQLLYLEPEVPHVPHREELKAIFTKEEFASLNWSVPSDTFQHFTRLLSLPQYSYSILLGLTVSVGGLTESLVKSSSMSLLSYLQPVSKDQTQLDVFTSALLKVFNDHQKVDRVTLPMFKMLDQLLNNGCFNLYDESTSSTFAVDFFECCKTEISRCGEVQKLLASVDVFCDLLMFHGSTRSKIIFQLMVFLCHKYPIVRKTTANKLYESLLTYDDLVSDENVDEAMTVLSETQWDQPIAEIRPIRNQLCNLFGVSPPIARTKPAIQK